MTLDDTPITIPGYTGAVEIVSYTLPTCVKTTGTGAFTTDDFCYQNGQLKINIGTQCNIGGTYAFNFDTDCFPNANTQNCKGKVLSANAQIGTANANNVLELDLCSSLYNTVAAVTGVMVADKPNGYFFGDMVTLTATFTSPDLPIYESRLTKMILGRTPLPARPTLAPPPPSTAPTTPRWLTRLPAPLPPVLSPPSPPTLASPTLPALTSSS